MVQATQETWSPAAGLLRFATAGAVDDGKSTLIGRLLHDSKSLLADQLEAVELASKERGDEQVDLAMLTDGLRAEREQGITIDVAHRYFETSNRAFIIADTPGHAQYTRNMVTGASHSELAIVLVDARNGLTEQSRRHAVLTGLLRVPQLVLAVNKMDLVDYDQKVFDRIKAEFAELTENFPTLDVTAIPISALRGDNVVEPSDAMPWYDGPCLLRHLESVRIDNGVERAGFRFPVQYVLNTSNAGGYRGFAGQVAGGVVAEGDEVLHLPSGKQSRVASVDTADGALAEARSPRSVSLRISDDIDVTRGDMLCSASAAANVTDTLEATVCWMAANLTLRPESRLLFKHTTRTVRAEVSALHHRLDVTTLQRDRVDELELNDIGSVDLRLDEPVFCDPYEYNRTTGGGLLIDEATNATVGAVMMTRITGGH